MIGYVSGPYSGDGPDDIADNINNARIVARALWEAGHVALCPHLNTAHFEQDCDAKYDDYIKGDLELILGCDFVVMIPGWESSKGATSHWRSRNSISPRR